MNAHGRGTLAATALFCAFAAAMTILLGLVAAAVTGCCATAGKCPAIPDPDVEAPAEARASACHRAGLRLAELKCPTARPDWDTFCARMLEERVPLRPSCIASIKACEEVDSRCR